MVIERSYYSPRWYLWLVEFARKSGAQTYPLPGCNIVARSAEEAGAEGLAVFREAWKDDASWWIVSTVRMLHLVNGCASPQDGASGTKE